MSPVTVMSTKKTTVTLEALSLTSCSKTSLFLSRSGYIMVYHGIIPGLFTASILRHWTRLVATSIGMPHFWAQMGGFTSEPVGPGASSALIYNVRQRHPQGHKPMIDYDLVSLALGSRGSMLERVCPCLSPGRDDIKNIQKHILCND